jgi:hypothetical protein
MNEDWHAPACDGGSCGEAEHLLEFDSQDRQFSGGIVQDNIATTGSNYGRRRIFVKTVTLFSGKEALQGRQEREPGKLLCRADTCKPGKKPCFRGHYKGFFGKIRVSLYWKYFPQQLRQPPRYDEVLS